jgi:sugar phosphate permease
MAWPVYTAILIHGPCYVFVYVVGVLYVDRLADSAQRGAAQGMLALTTTGVGHLLGSFSVGFAQEVFLTPEGTSPPPYHWTEFWTVFAGLSLIAVLVFQIAFKPQRSALEPSVHFDEVN